MKQVQVVSFKKMLIYVCKMKKKLSVMVLVFMFALNGCSMMGLDLTENRTMAISKPPYTIVLEGDLRHKDLRVAKDIMRFLSKQEFQGITNSEFKVIVNDQTAVNKSDIITHGDNTEKSFVVDPLGVSREE